MRLNAHFDMLPERAFEKRGFGRAPSTLEGGKGGGGGPSQTTAYQTNLPEYAEPYVMNMLGAAQNQLFTTTPGANGQPGQITGFKPYTPYSTDPTQYFAGPSSLQNSAYNAAGQLQSPYQYQTGTQLANQAGFGQLGTVGQAGMYGQRGANIGQMGLMGAMPAFSAGQQYANQVTNPNAVQSYMSPYQQNVTDIAKMNAVREAQIAGQQANLGAARQGTYGGARQALASAERERNLLSNLSNIQAQGSQAAYDKAIANQQFGANLGLQGISTGLQGISQGLAGTAQGLQGVGAQQAGYAGAGQAASTLGQLGSSQNATDTANINLQNTLGGQQQQYQQNIINQAIQDYATQQQYPYMQLSTMSNLLRGLPMQGMTTQQYQAQAPMAQQAAGLLGAYGAYKGAFKEGGAVQRYDVGGSIKAKAEKMLEADPDGSTLKGLLASTKSPQQRMILNDVLSGIAAGNTGKLGTNLAGGGIIAFANEGAVKDPTKEEMTDEERAEYIKNNEALQRSIAAANLPSSVLSGIAKYNPVTGFGIPSSIASGIKNFVNESPEDQATRFRKASARKEQADNPTQEVPAVKTATQRQEDADVAEATALANAKAQMSKADYANAAKFLQTNAPAANPNAPGANPNAPAISTGINPGEKMGIDDAYARVLKLTGQDQVPQEMTDYLNMLKEKSGKVGELSSEAGRMNKALAFLEAGATPGGLGAAAIAGGKSFLTGEAANREKYNKMELEYGKMQSDYRKAELERAKGNFEAAEKLFDKAEERKKDLEVARINVSKPGEFEKMYAAYAAGEKAEGRTPSFEAFRRAYSGADEDLVRLTKADAAVKILKEDTTPGGYMQLAASKKPEDKQKAADMLAAVYRRYNIDPTTGAVMGSQTASNAGGNRLKFDASGKQI